jgi:hypothetical protein
MVVFMAAQETAAPAWLPLLFLAIPVVLMGWLLAKAIPMRRRYNRVRRGPLMRPVEGIPIGSAKAISDGGVIPSQNLLEALAIAPEDHGPKGGLPHDEGSGATMLGLRSRVPLNTSGPSEPIVYWGVRDGRQVFVRLGVDEKGEGGEIYTNRRLRQCTVVRIALPSFRLRGDDGLLTLEEGRLPRPAEVVLAALSRSPDIWRDLRIVAGSDGIVAVRPQIGDVLGGWIYDLWLLERIADATRAAPLARARIGPAWKVPYELGRR